MNKFTSRFARLGRKSMEFKNLGDNGKMIMYAYLSARTTFSTRLNLNNEL